MGLVAELLNDVPAAAKYRAELEAMEQENERLRAENADLEEELAEYLQQWETLDSDAVRTLEYLSQFERGHPHEIAQACQINIQCVESQLRFLATWQYVHAPVNGSEPMFALARKGRRYLSDRGLLKGNMHELVTSDRVR